MRHLRLYENFEEATWDGRYIKLADGTIMSMPKEGDGALVFDDKGDWFHVYKQRDGSIYGMADSYDMSWKDEQEFVDAINANKYQYAGVE